MGSASGIGCRGRRAPVGCWDVVPFALIRDHFDFLIKSRREKGEWELESSPLELVGFF